ncbi:MAG: MFS transporter [Deltaproteobacteria bacterium]|nr:MFS transporter [Deltaproteobacteria bacterium]
MAPARKRLSPAVRYRHLIRTSTGLRNLWLGKLISFAGDWLNAVAVLAAVQELSSTAAALTLVTLARTLAVLVIAPIAGPLIDRLDRRRLLLIVDALRAACALGLVVAYQLESLVGLYIGLAAIMMCAGVAIPTQHAIVPRLVARADIPAANGLLAGTWAVMVAVGAAVGGVATAYLGIHAALVIDALTFIISLAFFSRMPALPAQTEPSQARATGFVACLGYLAARPQVLALTLLKPALQMLGGLLAFLPLFSTGVLGGASGAVYLGILFASRGLGAVIGTIYLRRLMGDSLARLRRGMLSAYALVAAGYAALATATNMWHAAAAICIVGVGHSVGWIAGTSLLQLESDDRFHGRLFSVEFGLGMVLMAAASVVAGTALDSGASLRTVTLVFAVVAAALVAFAGAALVPADEVPQTATRGRAPGPDVQVLDRLQPVTLITAALRARRSPIPLELFARKVDER